MRWERAEKIREETMSEAPVKATPEYLKAQLFVDGQLEKLKAHYLSADNPQQTREMARNALIDRVASHDKLLEALKELVRVVGGTLQGYGILEAPMRAAEAAIQSAEEQPK